MSIINNFTAYVKQIWENRPSTKSPVSAERLGYMEDGIKMNSDAMEKVAAAVLSTIVNDPDKIASMAALYAVNQTVTANAAAIAELNSKIKINSTYIETEYSDKNIYCGWNDFVAQIILDGLNIPKGEFACIATLPQNIRPLGIRYYTNYDPNGAVVRFTLQTSGEVIAYRYTDIEAINTVITFCYLK